MALLHDKFVQIETLPDLQQLIGYTEDGETSLLELKSIREELKKSNRQEYKALLAKEICAFLNSNDGIVAWGADFDRDTKKLVISNESSMNLADEFDRLLPQMIDPVPTGIETKLIHDKSNGECLIIFVPRGELAPYRVGDWECVDKKRILNRYFMRSGTQSVKIPEAIVRSMYLANGRMPRITCSVDVRILDDHSISLNTVISPDKTTFVNNYYCTRDVVLLGGSLEVINIRKESDSWESMDLLFGRISEKPIYPGEEAYAIDSNKVLTHDDRYNDFMFLSGLNDNNADAESGRAPFKEQFHNLYVRSDIFKQIFAVATRTTFACQNVPAKTNTKLFIIGNIGLRNEIAELDEAQFSRRKVMEPLEKKYDAEIYIPTTYPDALIVDDLASGAIHMEPDKIRIKLSHVDNTLRFLTRDK